MPTMGLEKFVKWLWIAGIVVWFTALPFLYWRIWEAQTSAQSSLSCGRLGVVAGGGLLWFMAGNIRQRRLKIARGT
jgi:hypothetical protein